MDFVSKALGSFNIGLPFTQGAQINLAPSFPFSLYEGTLKKDNSEICIFDFQDKHVALAELATTNLKNITAAGVIRHIDTVTSGRHAYVLTERVLPVNYHANSDTMNQFIVNSVWNTLLSIHSLGYQHNAICPATVMISQSSGEPVLIGFEFSTANGNVVNPDVALFYPSLAPPDGWTSPTIDTYQFGLFLKQVLPDEKIMINGLTASRRPVLNDKLRSMPSNQFTSNKLTRLIDTLSTLNNQSPERVQSICELVIETSEEFDLVFLSRKILPQLFDTNNSATLHTCLLLIGKIQTETQKKELKPDDPIITYLIQQYSSLDRVVRLELLTALPAYIDIIPKQVVQSKLMPKMGFGFSDSNVMVRKASVSAVKHLIPKMTARQINSDLLKLLAKTHGDSEPEVRALTTTLLCQIADQIDSHGVISTALGRALKDNEPRCREAALQGVTMIKFSEKEIAEKLLGPAALGILDKNVDVAAQAWRVTDNLLNLIKEKSSASGPAAPQTAIDTNSLELKAENAQIPTTSLGSSANNKKTNQIEVDFKAPSAFETPSQDQDQGGAWDWEQDNDEEGIDVDEEAWGW